MLKTKPLPTLRFELMALEHMILSIVTLGLWLIVWLIMGIRGGEKQLKLSVDEYGRVSQVGPY